MLKLNLNANKLYGSTDPFILIVKEIQKRMPSLEQNTKKQVLVSLFNN